MNNLFKDTNSEACNEAINVLPLSPILNSGVKAIRKLRKKKKTKPECKLLSNNDNISQGLDKINESEVFLKNEENNVENIIKRIKVLEEQEKCNLLLAQRINNNKKVKTPRDKHVKTTKIPLEKIVFKTSRSSSRNLFQTSTKDESFSDIIVLPEEQNISNICPSKNKCLNDIQRKHITSIVQNRNFNDLERINLNAAKISTSSLECNKQKYKLNSCNDSVFSTSENINTLECNKHLALKTNNIKNIFHNENFDDLKLNNLEHFKTANTIVQCTDIKRNDTEPNLQETPNNPEKVGTFQNIFDGENFDDLIPNNFEGFKTAITIIHKRKQGSNSKENEIVMPINLNNSEEAIQGRDIFQGEIFDNLKPNNFEGSNTTNVTIKDFPTNCEKIGKVQNIFQGENFDDLKFNNFDGFKTANTIFKHSNINREKHIGSDIKEIPSTCKGPKAIRNIFQGENFDDLKTNNFEGFKTANSAIKHSNINPKMHITLEIKEKFKNEISEIQSSSKDAKRVKYIFQGENFDDLKTNNFEGFKTANSAIKHSNINPEMYITSEIKEKIKTEISEIHSSSKDARVKNIFQGENFDDLKTNNFEGFKTAHSIIKHSNINSEKYIASNIKENLKNGISETQSSSKDARVKNIFQGENFEDLKTNNFEGFKTVNAPSNINTKERITNKLNNENTSEDFNDLYKGNLEGFKESVDNRNENSNTPNCYKRIQNISSNRYSSRSNAISNNTINSENIPTFKNIFIGENFDDLNLNSIGCQSFTPAAKHKIISKRKSFVNPLISNESTDEFLGFSCREQETTFSLSNCYHDLVSVVQNIYNNLAEKTVIVPKSLEYICRTIQENVKVLLPKPINRRKRKFSESIRNNVCKSNEIYQTPNNSIKRSRKLGCYLSPTIHINELEYSKAQNLFHDILPTSTPVKPNSSSTTLLPIACNLTPIRRDKSNYRNSATYNSSINVLNDDTLVNESCNMSRFIFNKPSNDDVTEWISNLLEEQRLLQDRLRINREKINILESQRNVIQKIDTVRHKISSKVKPGILYNAKVNSQKISLKDFVNNKFPEINILTPLNDINPQNSHLIHFRLEDSRLSHIETEDGAVLVPNLENRIGITEIEHSFKLMNGIDVNLIPNGWIRNHFKWIVWKLSSYERMFPNKFSGCLCIENIIQQLKYRYDLEIDRVKRSALRKIYEKDDIPQKTMVLCVSKIIKNNGNQELELTDGWYAIRTIIDKPLSKQILKAKIRLGVKLVISGAELVNCDGCFPLEAPEETYLKIYFNSTRRAVWWAKLGYQKDVRPFPISLSSINMEGGKIGYIRCYIFRVYPVVYMEKNHQGNVWRNKKAEEHYVQEFEANHMRELEKISSKFEIGIERSNMISKVTRPSKDIRSVDNPEDLYEICKNWEAEDLQDLSATQQTLLQNFVTQKMRQDQEKALNQIIKRRQNLEQRSVKSLLKVKLLDTSGQIDQPYDFHVWNPQEEHFHELKENEIVSIFNTATNIKWGLNATQNTFFRRETNSQSEVFNGFTRAVTYISKLKEFTSLLSQFKEFDTIGIPVKKSTTNLQQELWLTDFNENLLLIRISVPPDIVLLLDKVEEGQPVLLCNLSLQEHFPEYTIARADNCSTCIKYPDSKQMQSELNKFENILKTKDVKSLLTQCKLKIKKLFSHNMDELDEMDCTQMTATDIVLLQCVDKLI